MVDFLNDLNDVQRNAVENADGPSLIIAGAGSGKTRALTYRIAYLLHQGVSPRTILALTFTNKAAAEMKDRIASLVGYEKAKYIWMGTFHSVFARILRQEGHLLGYTQKFTIYDTLDSKSAISAIIKELQLDPQLYKPGEILGRISSAKNNLVTWQAYQTNQQLKMMDEASKRPRISDIYSMYSRRCKKADAMDFDDLLLNMNILFRDFPDVLDRYQQKFGYVLVDEYQDTNFSQYKIVNKLAARHRNLCVVGDDAQSIYSFRGARIENILHFKTDYPDHKLFKLEQNYRSTQMIVNAANSIIQKNKNQIHKTVWSQNEIGEKIRVVETATDHEEAYAVINSIVETRSLSNAEYSDFAILYRTNAQSRIFEESLRKKNIPYKIYGSQSFYQRKEIKDLLAYLKLAINPHDDEALKRVINYPARGIGDTTLSKIEVCANEKELSIWSVITQYEQFPLDINKGTWARIMGFIKLINGFSDSIYTLNAYDLAMQVVQASAIINDLKTENSIENLSRIENIEELLNSIKDSVEHSEEELFTLDKYLENVSLLTDQDNEKDEDKNKVTLMTVHASKGLEFKYVYIVGLEEMLFPNQMSFSSPQELEEERRLFYVALTRTCTRAILTYTLSRYRWGNPVDCTPSRFISEIDSRYLELPENSVMNPLTPRISYSGFGKNGGGAVRASTADRYMPRPETVSTVISRKPVINDPSFKPDDPRTLRVGYAVEHQTFGRGTITSMEGNMPDTKAVVNFDASGEKKLLLKFARLRILNNE